MTAGSAKCIMLIPVKKGRTAKVVTVTAIAVAAAAVVVADTQVAIVEMVEAEMVEAEIVTAEEEGMVEIVATVGRVATVVEMAAAATVVEMAATAVIVIASRAMVDTKTATQAVVEAVIQRLDMVIPHRADPKVMDIALVAARAIMETRSDHLFRCSHRICLCDC